MLGFVKFSVVGAGLGQLAGLFANLAEEPVSHGTVLVLTVASLCLGARADPTELVVLQELLLPLSVITLEDCASTINEKTSGLTTLW